VPLRYCRPATDIMLTTQGVAANFGLINNYSPLAYNGLHYVKIA